ncbi:MAG: ABC transporter permease [Fibrobacteria bacterium]|nr:ABC transporter permease [Fibrobacteria bacterium]
MKQKQILRVLAKKTGQLILSIIAASLLVFLIVQLTPGNMAEIHSLAPATIEKLNLDKPIWLQYIYWLGNCLTLNFGVSLTDGTPVNELLLQYAGTTFGLTIGSMFLSLLISVPIAILLGISAESKSGKVISSIIYSISSIPVFVVGYIVLGIVFGVFKFYPLVMPEGEFEFWPWVTYYILPIFVLAIGNGTLGEFVRVLMLEIRHTSHALYIKAARSRGTSLLKHYIRPVIIPFLSIVVSRFAVLISGVIVVERIFNRRGLGWLTWEATLNRDFFVIMAVTLLTALLIRVLMFAQEMLAYSLDPRLRKG